MSKCDFIKLSPRRRQRPKSHRFKTVAQGSIRKEFSRFNLCDSLLSCFSVNMIALQLSNLDKGAAKGLCLEFILHEYAKALKIAAGLTHATPDDALSDLEKLFTDSYNTTVLQQPGVLDKLCFYCEALVQTSKIGENLLDAIDELRTVVAKPRAQLARSLRSTPHSGSPVTTDSFHAIHQQLQAFFPRLLPIIKECSDSESALFSLLELRETLNRHLGEKTVENLLQNLFPEGPQTLRQTLSDGFSRRGFCDFCQRHEALFKGLTWQTNAQPAAPKL